MLRDRYGRGLAEEHELVEALYRDPDFDFSGVILETPARERYNRSLVDLHLREPALQDPEPLPDDWSMEDFDQHCQSHWHMPEHYQNLDVWEHLAAEIGRVQQQGQFGQDHLDRVLREMDLFEQRGLMPLLRYLIYLVSVMRENGVVWGVGRGSSVSSYVLYLIGVHKIDSVKYNLSIEEFLK
jgi:DNA polymerase III alpha subunit